MPTDLIKFFDSSTIQSCFVRFSTDQIEQTDAVVFYVSANLQFINPNQISATCDNRLGHKYVILSESNPERQTVAAM